MGDGAGLGVSEEKAMDCKTRERLLQLLSAGDIYFNGFGMRGKTYLTETKTTPEILVSSLRIVGIRSHCYTEPPFPTGYRDAWLIPSIDNLHCGRSSPGKISFRKPLQRIRMHILSG
jgi:hypothetical protein